MPLSSKEDTKEKLSNVEALKRELQFRKKLNFITNKIHASKAIDEILINLSDNILSLFDAERVTIYTVDGAKKELVSRFKTKEESNEIRFPLNNRSIAGYCGMSSKVINIVNTYDNNELKQKHPELKFDKSWDEKTGYKMRQVLVAPIKFNKYLLGVIQLINKVTGNHFTLEDQKSATEIAKILGIAFYNHRLLKQQNRKTKFDYLITNNIIARKDLEQAIVVARKTKRSVASVLMSDYHIAKKDIGTSLSIFFKTRFISYDEKMSVPGQLLRGLRPVYLKNNLFVPVEKSDSTIVVTMENPNYLPGTGILV